MKKKTIILLLASLVISSSGIAQDPLDELLNDMASNQPNITENTFKASRIMNGHSVEQPAIGEMEFRISHRFGRLNGGGYELFGLDDATIHFSLEYTPINRITVGIGRSNWKKTYDGYIKASLLRQQKGKKNIPLSVSYLTSLEARTLKTEINDYRWYHRLNYTHQLLAARKFNERLSLQVMPGLVHKNITESADMVNDVLFLGIGGRFKLTKHLSINADAYIVDHKTQPAGVSYYNPITVGINLETGGHVFQILLTNASPMREAGYLTETTGSWSKGDIHLGFNISRMFNLYNK